VCGRRPYRGGYTRSQLLDDLDNRIEVSFSGSPTVATWRSSGRIPISSVAAGYGAEPAAISAGTWIATSLRFRGPQTPIGYH